MDILSNEEKAAILLLSLEENKAAEVMKHLRPSEIRRIGKYMSRISTIHADTLNTVAKEFITIAKDKGGTLSVQPEAISNLVSRALGEKEAKDMLTEGGFGKSFGNTIAEKLRDIDPKMLQEFTRTEHPQTIALILANLKPESAVIILESFSPEMQVEVAKRMATLKSVPHEFVEEVARTLEKEILSSGSEEQQMGGIKVMSEIINRMNPANESAIMVSLENIDPDLAYQIRGLMFTFDDVLKLDDKSLQELLREVGTEDLAKALKLVEPGQREKIYRNMSKRGAEMLKEDIELMPPTRMSEVEGSQRNIIDAVKKLEAEGKVVLSRGDKEDEFV